MKYIEKILDAAARTAEVFEKNPRGAALVLACLLTVILLPMAMRVLLW